MLVPALQLAALRCANWNCKTRVQPALMHLQEDVYCSGDKGMEKQRRLTVLAILAVTAVLKAWRACRLSPWAMPPAVIALATTPAHCSVPWVATGSSRSPAAVVGEALAACIAH